jgi:regulator of sirC expression with transglutaminase-like and TPR domain
LPLGAMVSRMFNNLRGIYFKAKDWSRSIRVMERMRLLRPEDASLRRDLGACYVKLGQPGKAIGHLRHYLEVATEADDVEKIRELLNTAIKTVAQWN